MPRESSSHRLYPTRVEALSRPIHRPALYLKRAAVAASYPIRGIWYFLRHREFWPLFAGRIMPLSLISFLVYFVLFTFTFLPQFAFLALFHGWGAWVNAVVLVLGEGLVIIQGLFEGFFVDECRVDVFDVSFSCSLKIPAHNLGHAHQLLSHESRLASPDFVPRCSRCRQNAGQANEAGHLHPMEPHPDRRAHLFPTAQPDSLRRHSRLHHHHRSATWQAGALPMVSAQGVLPRPAEEGNARPRLGVRLVWNCGHGIGIDSRLRSLLPPHDNDRRRHVGGAHRKGGTEGSCASSHSRGGSLSGAAVLFGYSLMIGRPH